ncbi:hypothetical protein BABINDRAFT_160516, partial [Babjeviella inositovora NRRL Y-12698]
MDSGTRAWAIESVDTKKLKIPLFILGGNLQHGTRLDLIHVKATCLVGVDYSRVKMAGVKDYP